MQETDQTFISQKSLALIGELWAMSIISVL